MKSLGRKQDSHRSQCRSSRMTKRCQRVLRRYNARQTRVFAAKDKTFNTEEMREQRIRGETTSTPRRRRNRGSVKRRKPTAKPFSRRLAQINTDGFQTKHAYQSLPRRRPPRRVDSGREGKQLQRVLRRYKPRQTRVLKLPTFALAG